MLDPLASEMCEVLMDLRPLLLGHLDLRAASSARRTGGGLGLGPPRLLGTRGPRVRPPLPTPLLARGLGLRRGVALGGPLAPCGPGPEAAAAPGLAHAAARAGPESAAGPGPGDDAAAFRPAPAAASRWASASARSCRGPCARVPGSWTCRPWDPAPCCGAPPGARRSVRSVGPGREQAPRRAPARRLQW